jgi:two-component sensor histidine kinase
MKLFSPDVSAIDDFYLKGKFKLVWRLCMLFFFAFITLFFTTLNSSISESIVYAICVLVAVLSLAYLHFSKKSKLIYFTLIVSGTIIAWYTANFFDELIHIGDFLWIVLIVIFAFFGLGKKIGFIFLTANVMTVLHYTLFSVNANIINLKILNPMERVGLAVEITIALFSICYVVYQSIIFHNYSLKDVLNKNESLTKKNELIEFQNKEKDLLVQEIHHRVKNNLQIIISLLRLQTNQNLSEQTNSQFDEAIGRIMVMSQIHQKLYQNNQMAEVELNAYLNDLLDDVLNANSMNESIVGEVKTDVKHLGINTIVPLGLMLNELIMNSVKHAFSESEKGKIEIEVNASKVKPGFFDVSYHDTGTWTEKPADYQGFGTELLNTLTEQLEGRYKLEINDNKAHHLFIIKNLD